MAATRRDARRCTLGWAITALGLLIGPESFVHAQVPTTPGAITFPRVEAAEAQPPGATRRLYWVVDLLGASVTAEDENLRTAISNWLSDPARRQTNPVWVLDPRTQSSVLEALFGALKDYEFQRQDSFRVPPARTESRPNAEVRFTYRRRPLPTVHDITIELCTEQATRACIDRSGGAARSVAAELTEVDPGPIATGVTARGIALSAEVPAPSDVARIRAAFGPVAAAALKLADEAGVRVGAQPANSSLDNAQNAITASLVATIRGVGGDRPTPAAVLDWLDFEAGRLRIFVRGLRVVKDVQLEVPLTRVDTVHGSASEIAQRRQNALDLKAEIERRASDRLAGPFESLRDTVPTNDSLRRVLMAVESDADLRPPAQTTFKGERLEFVARDSIATYGFEATIAGGWSAEDGAFGQGTFAGDNLFRLTRLQQKRVESEAVSFSGLTETQRLSAAFHLATSSSRSSGGSLVRGIHVNALLLRDRDQLFGNAQNSRLSFGSRVVSPSYEVVLKAASRDADGSQRATLTAWRATGGMTLAWGRVRNEEGTFAAPAPETGTYIGLTTTQEVQITREVRRATEGGFGEVRLRAAATALYAPGWLDFGFGRVDGVIDIGARLGVARSRDFLVRYRTNLAGTSAGAPLFELPRLGGERLRGIEDGELIGRRAGSAQLSGGPSLEHLVTWFGKERPDGGRFGPFPFADTYITAFLDRGAVSDRASFGGLLWPAQATGYGVALELHGLPLSGQRARLTFGYGRSADSTRHRGGMVVTTLSIDLN